MKVNKSFKFCMGMLIGLLTICILIQYMPHHHHDGRICIEKTESLKHHQDSHDDCQLERSSMEFKGISKINLSPDADFIFLKLLFSFDFSEHFQLRSLRFVSGTPLSYTPYSVKSHKLRGSPLFS